MKVSGVRKRRSSKKDKRPEVLRYGRVKWVPVQWVEPVHDVRYPHHLERLVRSMRRRRSQGCMWHGRPLLVERVRAGARHPGIRWVAWTGSHRLAAAFAAGQWLVPIIEINARLYDHAHGRPETMTRLSETFDDESRLARLLMTKDTRAIRLMDKEVPRHEKDKAYRDRRRKAAAAEDKRPWTPLGRLLEARAASGNLVDVRHRPTGDTYRFHHDVLVQVFGVLEAKRAEKTEKKAA